MAEKGSKPQQQENYAIFNPQECGLLDVFLSLFPDAPAPAMRCTPGLRTRVDSSWPAKFAMLMMVLLITAARVLPMAGKFIELWLNSLNLNGGLLKLVFKIATGKALLVPEEGSDEHWSLIGLVDPRTDLLLLQNCDEFRNHSSYFTSESPGSKLMADVCMMASKLAYENEKIIRKVVTEQWKMHVVDILDCTNKFQSRSPSRIVILIDREEDAQAIIVAFRGMMPFNAYDWSSSFDFSWYEFPDLGRVHVGCLEALSMVDRQDMATFTRLKKNLSEKRAINQTVEEHSPAAEAEDFLQDETIRSDEFYNSADGENGQDVDENFDAVVDRNHEETVVDYENGQEKLQAISKRRLFLSGLSEAASEENKHLLAYDGACEKLKELLAAHKNARVFVTGHSLGGGIASVFTSLLFHAEEVAVTSRIAAIYTFGQPKVGDAEFAANLTVNLNHPENRSFRVVYSNDLVPRLPYDDLVFQFKHLRPCFFYSSSYDGETVKEEPNTNVNSANLLPSHASATWELVQSFMLRYKFGEAYKESVASTVFRLVGLLFPGIAAHSPVNYINAIRLGSEELDAEVMPSPDDMIED